ncbi:MAG: GH32 C-terminal domain-containing protein, partial [Ginsengibacter sp.]
MYVASKPVAELDKIQNEPVMKENYKVNRFSDLSDLSDLRNQFKLPCRINLKVKKIRDFTISLCNASGEKLLIGYDKKLNQYFIDRTMAGEADFNKE